MPLERWKPVVGFARYGSNDSAWRNPTIRHIPAQGKVSGFFGRVDGDNEDIEPLSMPVALPVMRH